MTHALGGDFRMFDTSGTPLADAGFDASTAHSYGTYTANSSTLIDNLYDLPTGEALTRVLTQVSWLQTGRD
jgi:hypothetical protein